MRKIIFLAFFTIALINVWAADQSSVRVNEPTDMLFKVTLAHSTSAAMQDVVSYSTRRDFFDFYTVENAQLNCYTRQKQVLSSDQYSSVNDKRTNHVDFSKAQSQLVYILAPSQKEFKDVCGV